MKLKPPSRFTPFVGGGNQRFGLSAAPTDLVVSGFHEAVKRRPGPIAYARHESVLTRVPVDVVRAALKIIFVPNAVFPESCLPNAAVTFVCRGRRNFFLGEARVELGLGEFLFDTLHAS
jgi:hypothetical protein